MENIEIFKNNINIKTGHIKNVIQILILNFGPVILEEMDFKILEGVKIAQEGVELLEKYSSTNSNIFCPLIWNALNLEKKYNIPKKYLNIKLSKEKKEKFFLLVNKLYKLKGWLLYVEKILKFDFSKHKLRGKNDFFNKYIIDLSKEFY